MQTALKRRLMRLAVTIHEHASKRSPLAPVRLPLDLWQHCTSLMRRANLARHHGFASAEERVRKQLMNELHALGVQIDQERECLQRPTAVDDFASPLEIYHDLIGLFDEFPEVDWCTRKRTLSVITEPILLEGVELGPFKISLYWDALDRSHCYIAAALDANPAASDESITHPHVQDGSICEGEGRPLIRAALSDGRLLDFYIIVRSLLTTYNSAGAYVSLDRWDGVHCQACGDLVSEGDLRECQCGSEEACESCLSCCGSCIEYVCDDCGSKCEHCGDLCCNSCSTSCAGCGQTFCHNCIHDGRCNSCVQEEDSEEPETPAESAPADTAV